ncbi:desmoglein-4-like [Brienomyrus brachyistius]|uniref:desmoglein-4-like n=1 Tax=Brienomyrus brachyistius TaxID=42636 RepID=UPI0020B36563|nr:desmoglein-4-like [Brienomyrus brachyistius]
MIPYHTEGMGEDKALPLLSAPALTSNSAHELVTTGKSAVLRESVRNGMYTQGWCDSISKGQVEKDYGIQRSTIDQEYRTASILHSDVLEHEKDVFDEIALPDIFLEEYYSQKAKQAAGGEVPNETFLGYSYEGGDSPEGSVGCCSVTEVDNDLSFLDDLDPKFMTLAEICRRPQTEITESVSEVKSIVQQSVMSAETKINRERLVNTAVEQHMAARSTPSSPVEKTVNTSYVATLPRQPYIIQQPVYYTTTPMYVVEPQVHNTILVSEQPSVSNMQTMYVVNGAPRSDSVILKDERVLVGPPAQDVAFPEHLGTLRSKENIVLVERKGPSGPVVQEVPARSNQGPPNMQTMFVLTAPPGPKGMVMRGQKVAIGPSDH